MTSAPLDVMDRQVVRLRSSLSTNPALPMRNAVNLASRSANRFHYGEMLSHMVKALLMKSRTHTTITAKEVYAGWLKGAWAIQLDRSPTLASRDRYSSAIGILQYRMRQR